MEESKVNNDLRREKLNYTIQQFNRRQVDQISSTTGRRFRGNGLLKRFHPDDLKKYLESPESYSNELIEFSEYLYYASPTYKRIIDFYATMPTYSYAIDTVKFLELKDANEIELVKKNYVRVLELADKMTLKHEFQKAMKVAWRQDVVYCYEMESKDSYYLKHMPRQHCRLSTIEDGVYNYEFDFSIFRNDKELLESYPEEFAMIYRNLENQAKRNNNLEDHFWYELDSNKAFAIKINEDTPVAIPPFLTSMEGALDEDMYRRIKKNKDALDNFMAITQRIPLNDDDQSMDNFRIHLDVAMDFHEQASEVLPEGIGLITSPMELKEIKLEKSKRDDDLEMQAKDNTLSNAGLPPNIFSTTNKTAGGIKYAIRYLEQIVFAQLRILERIVNRKFKRITGKHKFRLRFIDVTHYSTEDKFDQLLKGAQTSLPVKQELTSILGLSPLDMYNKALLENQILNLNDILEPLASTHTQSANSEGGRTAKGDQDVSESTEVWRENRVE